MKVSPSHFLGGIFLILLGALLLASSMGYLYLDDELTVSAVFASAGAVMLLAFFFFKAGGWALILGSISLFTGAAIYIDTTRILPDEGIGVVLFVLAGLVFLSALRGGKKNWWAIIPGGGCLVLAGNILLEILLWRSEQYHGVVFFGGIGLIFGIIYLLKDKTYRLGWAKYPSLVGFGMAALILVTVDFRDTFSQYIFPALLITGGILLIAGSARRARAAKTISVPREEEPVDIPETEDSQMAVSPSKKRRKKTT